MFYIYSNVHILTMGIKKQEKNVFFKNISFMFPDSKIV